MIILWWNFLAKNKGIYHIDLDNPVKISDEPVEDEPPIEENVTSARR